MNAVGIDVSKSQSTVAILRPFGEVACLSFDNLPLLQQRIGTLHQEGILRQEAAVSVYGLRKEVYLRCR